MNTNDEYDHIHIIFVFSLKISMPFGGQTWLVPGTFFRTTDVHSPGDTKILKGVVIFLNWFFSLYPELLTCLNINK